MATSRLNKKNRLNKILNIATKLINLKEKSLNDLDQQAICKKNAEALQIPYPPTALML